MSEPLSSHEIEDVLSSIRRLVSEELHPSNRGAGAGAGRADPPPQDGKLLLTPSLRVVADPAPQDLSAPPPADVPPVPDAMPSAFPDPDDSDLAALLADVAPASAPEHIPVTDAETLPDPAPAAVPGYDGDDEAFFATAPGDDDEILFAAPGEDDPWAPPSGQPAAAAPIEDDPEIPARPDAPRGHWSAETVPVPDIDWMQAEADWAEDDEPVPFHAHPRAGLTRDPLARAWADRAEAELHAELQEGGVVPPAAEIPAGTARAADRSGDSRWTGGGGGGDGGDGGGPGLFDAEDPMIDEETLRDIVRDIIREELAGTLGERITRNVRKLVRVEINRALTAREFE